MTGLPPTLERFGAELANAAHRDLVGRRRRRRLTRSAALVAVAAAGAVGVLSLVSTSGGPSIVDRAAAALQSSGDTILHYRMNAEEQNGDGTSVNWHSETWQLLVAPYTRRQIQVGSDGTHAESESQGGTNELYDASANTIYIATSQELSAVNMPKITIVSASRLARLTGNPKITVAYHLGKGATHPTIVATRQGAERFRKELARQRQREKADPGAAPEDFRSDILALLNSGKAQVTGHVTVDGRDAIRIESLDGRQVYLVDATTYDPIEWASTGTDGSVTLRFPVYEELPADSQSMALLDLVAQHPDAQVVRGARAYTAAESRLYPHG
jgi:hypothetical protein